MNDDFNSRLRKLVDGTGMSVYEISKAIGIGYATLASYYGNRSNPSFDNLVKLADYFAVPLDYLAGRCTEEQAREVSENYSATFMALRRAPYEAYLAGREKIKVHIGEAEEPWPYNLMGCVFEEPWEEIISEDQIAGIDTALGELTEREKDSVLLNLMDGMNLLQSGGVHGVTRERERQILAKALKKLRAPHRKALMMYGKEGVDRKSRLMKFRHELEKEAAEVAELKSRVEAEKANIADILRCEETNQDVKKLREMKLEEMDLSVRSFNCLHRAGFNTLGDVLDLVESGKLLKVRNLGKKSGEEILRVIFTITHKRYTLGGLLV